MTRLARCWQRFSAWKLALPFLVLLYLLLHSGLFSLSYFAADDYMQRAYLLGDEQLEAVGLMQGIESHSFPFFINNQFNFFDPATGNDQAMRNYGALPWWTQEGALLHLWRPLSSVSHWIDYQLWPDSPHMMQLHNALLLLVSLALVIGLYRALMPQRSIWLLAVLVFSLDLSVLMVGSWIAARNSVLVLCWLPLCLWLYHLSARKHSAYLLALIAYGLALLCAESAIVIGAYLAAYTFFYQRMRITHGLLLLLPFILLTVGWRLGYQQAGFGAMNIGQYLDPGRSPLAFLEHFVTQYPILLLQAVVGIDSLDLFLPAARGWFALAGWGLFTVLLLAGWQQRRQPLLLFWLAAMLLSLVPGVTMYSSDPRLVFHVHLAFAGFLAVLAWQWVQTERQRLSSMLLAFLLLWQIGIQGLGIAGLNGAALFTPLFNPQQFDQRLYGFADQLEENQHVVLINHPDAFRLMYLPYQYALQGRNIPQSVRLLATAQTPIELEKLSGQRYRLRPVGGFVLQDGDMKKLSAAQYAQALRAGSAIKYAGFFHDGDYRFQPGQQFSFAESLLTLRKLDTDGRPLVLDIDLKLAAERYTLFYWEWQQHRYQRLPEMTDGEKLKIAGP